MYQRILVPLDGSACAERAIPVAVRLARASGGSIVFIRVVIPVTLPGTYGAGMSGSVAVKPTINEKDLADANSYLAAILTGYADDLVGVKAEVDVEEGTMTETIFAEARLEHADLIVMCSHGKSGLRRWIVGSVAQQAVRRSPVPILILNEHGEVFPEASRPLRILIPLDGSERAESALEPAATLIAMLAPTTHGTLHLLRVIDLPTTYGGMKSQAYVNASLKDEVVHEAEEYVQKIAGRYREGPLAAAGLHITTSVALSASVPETIIKLAEETEGPDSTETSDLIAIATHGRTGLRHLMMGSVTEHVLGSTKLPLLVVRPQKLSAAAKEPVEAQPEKAPEEKAPTWVGLL